MAISRVDLEGVVVLGCGIFKSGLGMCSSTPMPISKVDSEGLLVLPCGNFKSGLGRCTSTPMPTFSRVDLEA